MNPSSPKKSPRLLLVDDNAAIHEDFKKILATPAQSNSALDDFEAALFEKPRHVIERVSFRLDSAFQGQEALALVEKSLGDNDPYALAFMDIRMPPGWDGVETIERIWKIYPELQMVICSAYSDYTWEDLISRFGHTDNLLILKKPFETVEVLQIAHALTKKWALALQSRLWMKDLDRLVRERTQELVAANEQLRVSEERFSTAFRTSPIAMAIISQPENRFVDANESFLNLVGFNPKDLLSQTASACQLWTEITERKIVGLKTSLHNHACSLRARDGSPREVVLWAEPIALDGGPCVLLIMEDITDQLRVENQLRQAQKMEAVGRLAAGVAHEFNNILTVIQGHAELLRAATVSPRQVMDSSTRISQVSQRAAALTRQLLTFSRQQPMQLKSLNLSTVVRTTEKMLRQILGERHELQFNCAPNLPTIQADEGNMEQILINLCLNARDAMPAGGPIRIETNQLTLTTETAGRHPDARPGQFVSLAVTDSGCGISPDILRRVFDPFFTTKEIGKGTGLGLATVHGIAKQHHGWIEATSEVNCGSTFRVFLPATPAVKGKCPDADALPDALPPNGRGETILVVEDEPIVRELARTALEQGGYRVLEAADADAALQVWREAATPIAVLITDMVLPNGMGGGKLAQLLCERDPQLQVICISGYGSETLREEMPATLAPGINFLSKPFEPTALLKAVKALLDRVDSARTNTRLALV